MKTARTVLDLGSVLRWSPGSLEERVKLVKPPLARLQPIAFAERLRRDVVPCAFTEIAFVLLTATRCETEALRDACAALHKDLQGCQHSAAKATRQPQRCIQDTKNHAHRRDLRSRSAELGPRQ